MIPPVSASAATRMPADRSRAYRYDANAASGAAASRWKKLSARTSETLRRKYSRSWEGVAFSAGKFVVASRSPNSSPHAKSATATAPEAAHTPSTRADIASALTSLFTDPFQHARRSPLPVAAPQFRSPPKADTPTAGTASLRLARGSHDMGADPGDARSPTGHNQRRRRGPDARARTKAGRDERVCAPAHRRKGNRGHRLWTRTPCICTTGLRQRVRAVRRGYGLREERAPIWRRAAIWDVRADDRFSLNAITRSWNARTAGPMVMCAYGADRLTDLQAAAGAGSPSMIPFACDTTSIQPLRGRSSSSCKSSDMTDLGDTAGEE